MFKIEKAEWTVYSDGDLTGAKTSQATVKLRIGRQEILTAQDGTGPVDALAKALLKAVGEIKPEVSEIRLISFSATHVNGKGKEGTAGDVLVQTDFARNGRQFRGVELSKNILDASFKTLVRGIEALL